MNKETALQNKIQIGIAQERKGEPMSDLIDRQAAIDVGGTRCLTNQ